MFACIERRARLISLFTITLVGSVLAACGSGGGSGLGMSPAATSCATTTSDCGTVLVSVTDAEGDFTAYVVDVLSISLERLDGTRIETLPASTRIDFAALTDLAELVSAATVAPGDIAGGTITLDYTNAEIFVEAAGAIVPAVATDATGAPLGLVDVSVTIDQHERLVVTRGRTHLLQIDFDLAASHTVDTSVSPAIAHAEPVLLAEAHPLEEKELRVRGALVDVDTTDASYRVRVRPWFSRVGDHGVVTVETTAATAFEIDGQAYGGQAGIPALADLQPGSLVTAFGLLDAGERVFTASVVNAADSASGGDMLAAIHGNIVARSGSSLTVKGAIAVRRDRAAHFQRTAIVEVGANTAVLRTGDVDGVYDDTDLSVGQRIVAFGTLTNAGSDSEPLILDATEARVRMLPTRLHGTVTGILSGQVNAAVRAIDRLGIEMFDFSGTGVSPQTDADPADYEIDTATLPLDAITVGEPVRVIGFVNRFGSAPPDFSGLTVIGPSALESALGVGWIPPGTASPLQSMGPASIVVDLANPEIGLRHHILMGAQLIDLFDLPASPSIEPAATRGVYGITEPGRIELFADFTRFVDALALRLGGGEKARALAAYGLFDEPANVMTTNRLVVHMTPAD